MNPDTILMKHYKDQISIAKAAGVTRQAVHNWFSRGAVSYAASVILADKMGIPAAKLQVRWVPHTGRVFSVKDARKIMASNTEVKRKARRITKRAAKRRK